MNIYDISLTVSPDLPVWPGDSPVLLEKVESMDEGAHANVSRLSASVHMGTHVDAPHHFLNDGRTVENLSLEILNGPANVLRIADVIDVITAEILEMAKIPTGVERLLFHTRNSSIWEGGGREFHEGFVAISANGAEWLVEHNLKLVGVDYLSVAPFRQSLPTHQILLRAGVVVLEGLNLNQVPAGNYTLYCLPLKLAGSDGAPARAILIT